MARWPRRGLRDALERLLERSRDGERWRGGVSEGERRRRRWVGLGVRLRDLFLELDGEREARRLKSSKARNL